jgi:hypothetical protein
MKTLEKQAPSLMDRISEIEKRADAATEGPWEENTSLHTDARIWIKSLDAGLYLKAGEARLWGTMQGNAAFIASSRQDIPWLCQTLRASLKQQDAMQRVVRATIQLREMLLNTNRWYTMAPCEYAEDVDAALADLDAITKEE